MIIWDCCLPQCSLQEPEQFGFLERERDPEQDLWEGGNGASLPPEEQRPIGVWGQRHLRYLWQHRKALYTELQVTGKLNDYLADLNEQAESMFLDLIKQMAEREGVIELLKAQDQMQWVQRMNNIRNRAMEVVDNDLIYA